MRVGAQHWEAFVDLAEKNPVLVTGKFNGAQGKAEGNALWQSIATILNSLGQGEKSVAEWRRAVTDWKCKVKTKAAKINASNSQTGGGPNDVPYLTPVEERLISLMGRKGFEGDSNIVELGNKNNKKKADPNKIMGEGARNSVPNPIQNVAQEVEVWHSEKVAPSTSSTSDHNYFYHEEVGTSNKNTETNKRKPNTGGDMNDENDQRKKKQKRANLTRIPRVSQNLEEMTKESLTILRSIDTNTSRIADSFEKIVIYFERKGQC